MPINSPSYLFVSNYFPPPFVGGSVVYNHFLHLAFGPETLVLAPAHSAAQHHDSSLPYAVLRLACALPTDAVASRWRRMFNGLTLFFKVLWLVKKLNIKVLHVGNLGKLGLTAAIVARLTGVKTVITIHGEELTTRPGRGALWWGWPGRGINALLYCCARRLDLVIVPSPTTQKILINMGFKPQHIAVITPGVDETKLPDIESLPKVMPEIPNSGPLIVCVGRLISRKGQDILLQAMPRVLDIYPKAHLVLAGSGPDENKLRLLMHRLGLAPCVSLLTQVSNPQVAWLYAHCSLFCMPNRTLSNGDSEGYGIVFLEAGAWGKPVIGGRAGGAVDAVDDGVTGLLVDSEDPNAVADGILHLLSQPDLGRRMGDAGRLKALSNAWQGKSEQFKILVEQLGHTKG